MSDALLTCPACDNLILADNEPCPYCGEIIEPGEPVSVESHIVSVASEPAKIGGARAAGIVGGSGIIGGGFDASAPLPQRLPQTQPASSSLKDVFRDLPQFAEPAQPVPLTEYPKFSTISQPNELVKTTPSAMVAPSSFTSTGMTHAQPVDNSSFWWGVGAFFLQPVGLILALIWRGTYPQRAKYLAIGAILGLLLGGGSGFHFFGW